MNLSGADGIMYMIGMEVGNVSKNVQQSKFLVTVIFSQCFLETLIRAAK